MVKRLLWEGAKLMIEQIFSFTIEITISLSLLMFMLISFSNKLDKRYISTCKYKMWLIVLFRLAIPFNITFPYFRLKILAPYRLTESISSVEPILLPIKNLQNLSLVEILTAIWFVGAFGYFVQHTIGYSIFKNNLNRWGQEIRDENTLEIYRNVKKQMVINDNIRVEYSPIIYTPMLTGFFKLKILLPDCNYSDKQIEMIFRHELTHYQRKDYLYKLLLLFVGTLHWFNPLVHMVIRKAGEDIETSCDSEIIEGRSLGFIKEYAQSILEVAKKSCVQKKWGILFTCMESGKDTLKHRLANLFEQNKRKKGIAFLIVILTISIMGSSTVFFRGLDANIDFAHKISEKNIESITMKVDELAPVDCTSQYKKSISSWLNNIEAEPFFKSRRSSKGKVTYIVVTKDGRKLEIIDLGDNYFRLNGEEYLSVNI